MSEVTWMRPSDKEQAWNFSPSISETISTGKFRPAVCDRREATKLNATPSNATAGAALTSATRTANRKLFIRILLTFLSFRGHDYQLYRHIGDEDGDNPEKVDSRLDWRLIGVSMGGSDTFQTASESKYD
jgi:hypothetical protein